VEVVAEGVEAFKPDGLAIEINTFQELLLVYLDQVAARRQITLPIHPIDNSVPKPVRIRRLGPDLAQRKIRFKARSPGTQLLVQQLRDFPQADHDDGPDSAEMSRRIMVELWNGKQAKRSNQRLRP